MIRVPGEHLSSIDRDERDEAWGRHGAVGGLDTQAGKLDSELLHQAIENGLEIAPRVEIARLVASDLFDGPGDDARCLQTTKRLGVQQDSVGQSRCDQSLEIVIDRVAEHRESAPVLEGHVGTIAGDGVGDRRKARGNQEDRGDKELLLPAGHAGRIT